MIVALLIVSIFLMLLVLVAVIILHLRARQPEPDAQTAVFAERIAQIAPMAQTVLEIRSYLDARREQEQRVAESIRNLETVIAGTQTKGAAGEHIVEAVFSRLPIDWQVRNFKVKGKPVEFGLRLPNALVLPVDSKWTATSETVRFVNSEDADEKQRIRKSIERNLSRKAKEVAKYIDPRITTPFALAVVPDAVYDLCGGLHTKVFEINVIVVSHSMLVPYLLLIYQTTLRASRDVDLQKIDSYLRDTEDGLRRISEEMEGRFSEAVNKLEKTHQEISSHLGKMTANLSGLRADTSPTLEEAPIYEMDNSATESQISDT